MAMTAESASVATAARKVHRIEVHPKASAGDPRGEAVLRDAAALGVKARGVRSARVYLIEAALAPEQVERVRAALLTNPVLEESALGAAPAAEGAELIEVHPLPGVMDPAAQTVREAVMELTGVADASVSTAERYELEGVTEAEAGLVAARLLSNAVIQRVHREPHWPGALPRGSAQEQPIRRVPVTGLADADLERLSREAHLFLDLHEMQAVRAYYREAGREPTDIELETLAQTWSEHCVHKTLKSTVTYRRTGGGAAIPGLDAPDERGARPGHEFHADGSVTIRNLLKSTVAAATFELIEDGVDWTLSVFKDNAGVIAFDDATAVNIKVETHNHPSAIEPYGGAATGVGGCIRDVIGTGLGAKPIANTDVFCVAHPDSFVEGETLPPGCLHPRRTLTRVVAGVRDYGNRMGIPTVNGAVAFDDRFVGNPLVFCGCVGVMPRDKIRGAARPGDLIVALGGRTGRDGVHGATFSSAELTDTHADEFAHAVQIGNAIEEKRLLDAILRARDAAGGPLYSAITDCGAGGFSSAVGEMGEEIGAEVDLERAPLKYDGLTYTEIWISEAQERMVLAVPEERLKVLARICEEERVEWCVLGRFGTEAKELVLRYRGAEVGRLGMDFLHDGLPTPVREAVWPGERAAGTMPPRPRAMRPSALKDALTALLANPNIASKRWIVRQYDHEVQGATVIKPLVGAAGEGPGDAAVVSPVAGSPRALAIGCGLALGLGDDAQGGDPYQMALAGVDECVRNLVCVGADPSRIAILDNFCWPSCKKPRNLGALVRAAAGCYDAAKAHRAPFVSGKDSLNNQFALADGRTIEIPYTLLITGVGIVQDKRRCATSDAKRAGSALVMVGETQGRLGGSQAFAMWGAEGEAATAPSVDLRAGCAAAGAVARVIREGLVLAAHDCSDGGLLVAVAEMLIGAAPAGQKAGLGAEMDLSLLPRCVRCPGVDTFVDGFEESPSRYVLEVGVEHLEAAQMVLAQAGVRSAVVGRLTDSGELRWGAAGLAAKVEELRAAWLGTLDW